MPPPAKPALDQVPAMPLPAVTQHGTPAAGQFGILFVCTGNLCRSVMAERLARQGLRDRLGLAARGFRVTSAGTASLDGCPVHPYAAEALSWLGTDADGAASHGLTAADVDAADLILAACREHRDAVVAMRPRASRRAYLLREFARLTAYASAAATARPPAHQGAADQTDAGAPSAGLPAAGYSAADQARHLVAEVAQLRGQVPYVEPAEDEIAEPVTDSAAFLACARVIDAAVSQALDALCSGLPAAQYRGRHTR